MDGNKNTSYRIVLGSVLPRCWCSRNRFQILRSLITIQWNQNIQTSSPTMYPSSSARSSAVHSSVKSIPSSPRTWRISLHLIMNKGVQSFQTGVPLLRARRWEEFYDNSALQRWSTSNSCWIVGRFTWWLAFVDTFSSTNLTKKYFFSLLSFSNLGIA